MKQPKYFYVVTTFGEDSWCDINGVLKHPNIYCRYIGSRYWPHTRQEARKAPTNLDCAGAEYRSEGAKIYQFENKPPYKFIKKVN